MFRSIPPVSMLLQGYFEKLIQGSRTDLRKTVSLTKFLELQH